MRRWRRSTTSPPAAARSRPSGRPASASSSPPGRPTRWRRSRSPRARPASRAASCSARPARSRWRGSSRRKIGLREQDQGYSLLPLAHATPRLFDAYAPLVVGSTLSFSESLETVPTDLVESVAHRPARRRRACSSACGATSSSGWAMPAGSSACRTAGRWAGCSRRRTRAAPGDAVRAVGAWLGRRLVGRRRRSARRASRACATRASAARSSRPSSLRWFWALGIPVREQYGQVETGGIVTTQGGERDLGTAGAPIDAAIEVRLDGEQLLVRSPGIASERSTGRTSRAQDGWFATGDLAPDRRRGTRRAGRPRRPRPHDASGEVISPAEIESALKASPYVRSAVVIAADRPFVGALVELRPRGRRGLGAATRDLRLDLRGAGRERPGQRARRGGGRGRRATRCHPSIACSHSASSRSRSATS